jgi:replicative DNA helicase
MVEMAGTLQPIDLVLLVEELDRHKELRAVGDAAYVSGLVDGVPDRPSIAHYVRIVKEKHSCVA